MFSKSKIGLRYLIILHHDKVLLRQSQKPINDLKDKDESQRPHKGQFIHDLKTLPIRNGDKSQWVRFSYFLDFCMVFVFYFSISYGLRFLNLSNIFLKSTNISLFNLSRYYNDRALCSSKNVPSITKDAKIYITVQQNSLSTPACRRLRNRSIFWRKPSLPFPQFTNSKIDVGIIILGMFYIHKTGISFWSVQFVR